MNRIERKWRPPLWLVVAGTLVAVLCLPLIGIFFVQDMAATMGFGRASYTAGFGVLAATFAVGWGLWRFLLSPVQTMRDRVRGLRAGDDGALDPLEHYGTSDMQALGQSFLDMGRALRSREAVLRGYADHVTHEFKSPLTVLRGAAELLGSPDLPPQERDKLIARISSATDRMTALLDAQRDFARAQEPAMGGEVRLSDVARGVTVVQDGMVPLTEHVLRLVLDHLVGNAKAEGASEIRVSYDGKLIVQDNGPGVSEGHRSRIFEPFFTSRRSGDGTGMGLPIVRRVLEAHDAQIALVPSDTGARFEVSF